MLPGFGRTRPGSDHDAPLAPDKVCANLIGVHVLFYSAAAYSPRCSATRLCGRPPEHGARVVSNWGLVPRIWATIDLAGIARRDEARCGTPGPSRLRQSEISDNPRSLTFRRSVNQQRFRSSLERALVGGSGRISVRPLHARTACSSWGRSPAAGRQAPQIARNIVEAQLSPTWETMGQNWSARAQSWSSRAQVWSNQAQRWSNGAPIWPNSANYALSKHAELWPKPARIEPKLGRIRPDFGRSGANLRQPHFGCGRNPRVVSVPAGVKVTGIP